MDATTRSPLRRLVLEYAVRPTHRSAFAGSLPDLDRATELWQVRETRREALALVPDEAVQRLSPIGSAELVLDRLEEARAAGATLPALFAQSLALEDPSGPAAAYRAVAAAARARAAAQVGGRP